MRRVNLFAVGSIGLIVAIAVAMLATKSFELRDGELPSPRQIASDFRLLTGETTDGKVGGIKLRCAKLSDGKRHLCTVYTNQSGVTQAISTRITEFRGPALSHAQETANEDAAAHFRAFAQICEAYVGKIDVKPANFNDTAGEDDFDRARVEGKINGHRYEITRTREYSETGLTVATWTITVFGGR